MRSGLILLLLANVATAALPTRSCALGFGYGAGASATGHLTFETLKDIFNSEGVKWGEGYGDMFELGVFPAGQLELYDVRDPNYKRALETIGFRGEALETELKRTYHGCCYSASRADGRGEFAAHSVIGINPEKFSKRYIAWVIAEEMAHARFARDPRWHKDREDLLIRHETAFALVDEFQAKFHAAKKIKGAARDNWNILKELSEVYTDLKGGQEDFRLILFLATKYSGKSLEDLSAENIVDFAYKVPADMWNLLDPADRRSLTRFNADLDARLARTRYTRVVE